MQELSKLSWLDHLLKKLAIERALNDFNKLLDEGERKFIVRLFTYSHLYSNAGTLQRASLIEIHYTVGMGNRGTGREAGSSTPIICIGRS